jgi:hypothetical protein
MRITSSFVAKVIAAAALVGTGDWLFWRGGGVGSNLGLFALAWAGATLLLTPAIRRDGRSWIAAAGALLFAVPLADSPGLLAFMLFWTGLTMAVLLPRAASFDHAGRWAIRLAVHGVVSIVGPWRDLLRMRRRLGDRMQVQSILPLLPLPLLGGAVFLALFAAANPMIGNALYDIGLPRLDGIAVARFLFWIVLLTTVWATLRPRKTPIRAAQPSAAPEMSLPGVTVGSVTLALLTFNALFALQNGLDIAFLWSGAPLPEGMTLATYAHRGAYPLIATALLAGLFVLVALRPGSDTAAVPAIRRLVVLWIAQNVFLVASSILRTLDYIQAYSLTRLRIAALIWMALVAVGLVLIVWRMLKGRSAAWLINANAAAALTVLAGSTMVDLGSIAASWNVRHAREAGGKGAALDLCYLARLGPSSLTSLVALEHGHELEPGFAERLAWVRSSVLDETVARQNNGEWTWRNARRLAEVDRMLDGKALPARPPAGPGWRDCDGTMRQPAESEARAVPSAPSTGSPIPLDPANATTAALTNEAAQ